MTGGKITNCTVQNLTLSYSGNCSQTTTGGVIGSFQGGMMDLCYNLGIFCIQGYDRVGGLIGKLSTFVDFQSLIETFKKVLLQK